MKEREVKVLGINLNAVEERLIQAGAVLLKDEDQVNWVFWADVLETPDGELGYLRLRSTKSRITDDSTFELTLKMKESAKGLRVYEEYTSQVSDPKAVIEMFELLGHPLRHRGEKHRKSYRWQGIDFEMDQWDKNTYPDPYLEIEVQSEDDLERALQLLEIPRELVSTKSISDLRKEWRENHANQSNNSTEGIGNRA
jgi:adenylate cyclase class 2